MVNNFTYIKQRIKYVADLKKITYSELYKIIEMTDGSFKTNAIHRPVNSNAIVNLYTKYPDIDLHWLITGRQKSEKTEEEFVIEKHIDYKEKYISAMEKISSLQDEKDKLNKEIISLIKSNGNLKNNDKLIYDKPELAK